MSFINYLIETRLKEQNLSEKHDLVLQQVIDGVDNGHVDYLGSKISFDIGEISDTPKLRGLKLVIRPGKTDSVKLGHAKDDTYAIVIDTTEALPEREAIDTFLAGKKVYAGFKKAYEKYIKNHFDSSKEYEPNDVENKVKHNSRDTFEDSYTGLIEAIRGQNEKYMAAVAEIDKELDNIANIGRKQALVLAKGKLKEEYLGKTDKEFISKAMALPEADFAKHLEKEWKEKLEARLKSYYNANGRQTSTEAPKSPEQE